MPALGELRDPSPMNHSRSAKLWPKTQPLAKHSLVSPLSHLAHSSTFCFSPVGFRRTPAGSRPCGSGQWVEVQAPCCSQVAHKQEKEVEDWVDMVRNEEEEEETKRRLKGKALEGSERPERYIGTKERRKMECCGCVVAKNKEGTFFYCKTLTNSQFVCVCDFPQVQVQVSGQICASVDCPLASFLFL